MSPDDARPVETTVSRQQWKTTVLAAMADYIDAGSIVAGATALSLWKDSFGMSGTTISVLGALGANGIGAGVGALVGGRFGDVLGRKRIYAWDLVVYMAGALLIAGAQNAAMLITGYAIIGLAVGADIPNSWSVIAELAPAGRRGRLSGLAQVAWNLGPLACALMAYALTPLGTLGTRLVFLHLFAVAFVTWYLRRGIAESVRWREADARERSLAPHAGLGARLLHVGAFRELFRPRYLGSMLLCIGVYGIWVIPAGTGGFFFPYILNTVGSVGQATSVLLQGFGLLVGTLSSLLIFMPLSDRVSHRWLFACGAGLQVVGMALFGLFPLTAGLALVQLFVVNLGSGFGQRSFYQIWSAELFPTRIRTTAQGFTFFVARTALGVWSFFVPHLATTGFRTFAWIMMSMYLLSGVIGVVWTPRTRGRSLEELAAARGDDAEPPLTATGEEVRHA